MNKFLEKLIEVAGIDKEASLLEPQIKEIESELELAENNLQQCEEALESISSGVKKAKVDIANNELAIQESNDKIALIDKKMGNVKSERERRALDAENGLAREKITFSNEEIAKLEKEIENLESKKGEAKDNIAKAKEELESTRDSANKRSEKINAQLRKIFGNKEKISKEIDHKVLIFYEKIRKWAKNTSIVPITRQACGGCFIKINDKVYSELMQSDDIITCPHCGRILYIEQAK